MGVLAECNVLSLLWFSKSPAEVYHDTAVVLNICLRSKG